jgi:hypothetical protein
MGSLQAVVHLYLFKRLVLALAAGPCEDHAFRTSSDATLHRRSQAGQSNAWAYLSLVKVHAGPRIYNQQAIL